MLARAVAGVRAPVRFVVAGAMANLKDRLASVFSKHTGPPQDDELVDFGKKHKGETFLEAWKDESWVKWTVEHLEPDGRDGPRTRWLEFVERQIKKFESQPASGGAASASGPSSASGGGHDETEPPASGGDRLDRMQAHIDALEEKMQVLSLVVRDLAGV